MTLDQKINYVELPARDFDAVQLFYEKAFNWTFTDYGPEYRAFTDGTIDGGFCRSEHCSSTANGAALVIVYASNLEQTRETIIASGGSIVRDIFFFSGRASFPVCRSAWQ